MSYQDTYFLDYNTALQIAKQQNRWNNKSYLQVCYYYAETEYSNDIDNLIFLPIEDMSNILANNNLRIPTIINFDGMNINDDLKMQITNDFHLNINDAQQKRIELNNQYYDTIKTANPDFTEPLRFYLLTHVSTTVMRYISQNIVNALKKENYNVYFHLYNGCEDLNCLKHIAQFNPHITISINHLNNHFLNNKIFNFIWFQDPMPILTNEEPLFLRKRDYLFHLTSGLGQQIKKIAYSSIYQPFCIDTDIYKVRDDIQRENKIVFIGSSYSKRIQTDLDKIVQNEMEILYELNGIISSQDIELLSIKHNITFEQVAHILSYIERDFLVLKLISLSDIITIEIYGNGWEIYPSIQPYFKGSLNYGEDISKIYNSARYAYAPGGYTLQQRTLESAASGCIPIVYDKRIQSQSENYTYIDDAVIYFNTMNQLSEILNDKTTPNKDLTALVNKHSYKNFTHKILDIVKTDLESQLVL